MAHVNSEAISNSLMWALSTPLPCCIAGHSGPDGGSIYKIHSRREHIGRDLKKYLIRPLYQVKSSISSLTG